MFVETRDGVRARAQSGLVGAFADGTPWPLGWVIALTWLGSLLCAGLLARGPKGVAGL